MPRLKAGLGFEDRTDPMHVFLAADQRGLGEVSANEVALGIHLRIDA